MDINEIADMVEISRGRIEEHAPPENIQRQVKQVYALSRQLLASGVSKEALQELSYDVCGLSSAQHLHCCGARPLSELIKKLEGMANG